MVNTVNFEAVIGLEIHAQLLTNSKLFCGCSSQFGANPNHHTCPVCLGLPGALPVLNQRAVEFATKAALATGCTVKTHSVFARKNYFYPDLPKGYQISQFDLPIAEDGFLVIDDVDNKKLRIRIKRIHMEEDAGKLLHDSLGQAEDKSLVDFNRAGVPLIEIVSEPDLRTPEQAGEYLKRWRQLVRYLGICDGNLEEGSMRCDANVSVRPVGDSNLYTKVEIKNINSFRFVQQAIQYEINRQIECVKTNEKILQETRLWDSQRNITRSMRSKEEAQDYRYFPEPDLIPLDITQVWIDSVKKILPELPQQKFERFQQAYQLSEYDVQFLIQEQETAAYFEECVATLPTAVQNAAIFKDLTNWMMGDFTKALKDHNQTFAACKVRPAQLVGLVLLIDSGKISGKIAKAVFEKMFASGADADKLVAEMGLQQISDTGALRSLVEGVLAASPKEVAEYKGGRDKLFGFFVGQVMKASKGQANPTVVNDLLKELLSNG